LEEKFVPWQLVCSTAGRDLGKFYFIYDVLEQGMVQVVNGEERKLSSPKKKNIKHLKAYPILATEIINKKNIGQKVTDLDIKKTLERQLPEISIKGG